MNRSADLGYCGSGAVRVVGRRGGWKQEPPHSGSGAKSAQPLGFGVIVSEMGKIRPAWTYIRIAAVNKRDHGYKHLGKHTSYS